MITNIIYFHIVNKDQVLGDLLDHVPLHLLEKAVAEEPYDMSDGNRGNNNNRGNNKHNHGSIYAVEGPVVLATAFKFRIVSLSSPMSLSMAAGDAFYFIQTNINYKYRRKSYNGERHSNTS